MNSSYYYDLMCKYDNLKKENEKKKEEYTKCLNKINDAKSILNNVKDGISSCLSNFLNGGYIDGGDTLDNGKLSESISILSNDVSLLDGVVSKINIKITDFNNNITKYINLYKSAKINYEYYKKQEVK